MRAPLYLSNLPQVGIGAVPVWDFPEQCSSQQPCPCLLVDRGLHFCWVHTRSRVAGSEVSTLFEGCKWMASFPGFMNHPG